MFQFKVQRFVCNMLQENCYVVSDDTKECMTVEEAPAAE